MADGDLEASLAHVVARDDLPSTVAYVASALPPDELLRLIKDLEREMKKAAKDLAFERAAELRDRLLELRRGE